MQNSLSKYLKTLNIILRQKTVYTMYTTLNIFDRQKILKRLPKFFLFNFDDVVRETDFVF